MHNLETIRVRAVLGRLYPVLTGHPDRWIGWRECNPGAPECKHETVVAGRCACGWEAAEHTVPAGTGPRDAPAMIAKTKDKLTGRIITKTVPEVRTGRELRLVRDSAVEVPRTFDIARALQCGDLELFDHTVQGAPGGPVAPASVQAGSPEHKAALEAAAATLKGPGPDTKITDQAPEADTAAPTGDSDGSK